MLKTANFTYLELIMERKFTHDEEFHDIVRNPDVLRRMTEKFLNNIIDELTLGVIFDLHRKYKTKAFDLEGEDDSKFITGNLPSNVNIFGQVTTKKKQVCECPICNKSVDVLGFMRHLADCMGYKPLHRQSKKASNNSSNNNNNYNKNMNNVSIKDRDHLPVTDIPSADDDDDPDWNSGYKRRKKRNNKPKPKKGKGTPNKKSNSDVDLNESMTIDIEGDEIEISIRDYLQDNSNHTSPAESVTNSNSSSNSSRKSKSKKKNARDRSSPNITNLD